MRGPSAWQVRAGCRSSKPPCRGIWYPSRMGQWSSRERPESGLGARIGSAIKSTRLGFGWTERDLAHRLGSNQSAIHWLELGSQRHLDVQLATTALDLLGIRVTIDANLVGLAERREQRDLVHARCVGYVVRQLRQRGWAVRTEVEVGEGRFRGWIDVLAFRGSDGALLVIEIKTEVEDFGRILRTLWWYVRSSLAAASAIGWRPRSIVPCLIALATIETDARLISNVELVRNALPGGAVALAEWIDDERAQRPAPSVGLIDPRSRRAAWLWGTRSDGRRSVAPYRDYADAARRLSDGAAARPGAPRAASMTQPVGQRAAQHARPSPTGDRASPGSPRSDSPDGSAPRPGPIRASRQPRPGRPRGRRPSSGSRPR